MRSSAESSRATTAAASSRSSIDSPWTPGSGLVMRLLALRVLAGALLLAADELLLDPRRRRERAEGDHRAGGAPAVPRLRLVVERGAQRAHDDGVLLAHAQQHQVHRQLEGEVLEEQREVEALVELDRDEDGLEREHRAGRRVAGVDLDERRGRCGGSPAARKRRHCSASSLSGPDEQAVEERVPQRLGRLLAEQQLGGLGPLRDGALAVGEDEPAADDLLEQRVERVARDELFGRRGRRRGGGVRESGAVWASRVHAGTGQERERLPHRSPKSASTLTAGSELPLSRDARASPRAARRRRASPPPRPPGAAARARW